jgi:predicted nucleic acid-binding protein
MTAKAFIDSNVYIYALANPKNQIDEFKRVVALSTLKTLLESQILVTSVQVLNELHSNLIKKFKLDDATVFKIIEESILPVTSIKSLNYQTYQHAYKLRANYHISYWDSLIVASALENNCNTLYSEDMQHQQKIENCVTIINPFQQQIK